MPNPQPLPTDAEQPAPVMDEPNVDITVSPPRDGQVESETLPVIPTPQQPEQKRSTMLRNELGIL